MELWETIIDSETENELRVLNAINQIGNNVKISDICKRASLSRGTVEKYVEILLETYRQGKWENFKLVFNEKKDISISYKNAKAFQTFLLSIVEKDVTICLAMQLLQKNEVKIVQFVEETYISESTLKRRARQLGTLLKKYNLKLHYSGGNLLLLGEEKQIRLLAYTFYWSLYKGSFWSFSMEERIRASSLYKKIYDPVLREWNLTNAEQIYLIVAINHLRLLKGHVIRFPEDFMAAYFSEAYLQEISDWSDMFALPRDEVLFLFLIAQTREKFYLNPKIRDETILFHKEKASDIYQATNTFLELFSSEIYPILNNERQELESFLFSAHLYSSLFSPLPSGVGEILDSDVYIDKYPVLFAKLSIILDKLAHSVSSDLFRNRRFLLGRYFLFSSQIFEVTRLEKEIIIVIDSDLPILAEKLFIQELESAFCHQYNLVILSVSNLKTKDKGDLVLTTNYISRLEDFFPPQRIVRIKQTLHESDIHRINQKIEEVLGKIN